MGLGRAQVLLTAQDVYFEKARLHAYISPNSSIGLEKTLVYSQSFKDLHICLVKSINHLFSVAYAT